MKKIILILGIIFLLIGISINPSSGINIDKKSIKIMSEGKTLFVGGSGPNNYTTIQEAINDAVDGDTVFVYDDSSPYYENIIIDKSISLIGENRNTTVIDGNYIGNVIEIIADKIIIWTGQPDSRALIFHNDIIFYSIPIREYIYPSLR